MKLQVSFDMTDLEKALEIAEKIEPYADIFEIGTLLLYRYGIEAVEAFRQSFEKKSLLVDTKIVDRGKESVMLFTQYSIDWITIMAGTQKDTIHAACAVAHSSKTQIMLDLLDSNAAGQSAMEAKQMGVHALLVHRPYDEKESLGFMEKWEMIRGNTDLPIFIAGKINRANLNDTLALHPDGIIVGSAIIKADDPAAEALYFYEQIQK